MSKIWIDLDNTPHIPFFKPIMEELSNRGHEIIITARDAYQVIQLADRFELKYTKIGHHYGKNKVFKVVGLVIRSLQLVAAVRKQKPVLAISHGSRSQLVAAFLMRIPSIMIYDYEFTTALTTISPTYIMVPDVIPISALAYPKDKVFRYPGIKEDVYVPRFRPDPSIREDLGINDKAIVVTIRPPATEAHYFNPLSEELFEHAMSYLLERPETQLVVVPRNKNQEEFVRKTWPSGFKSSKMIIPDHAVDGLDLMWFSDLVISGGGTMNREAAALGVPVYSIFRGKLGAVDSYLSQSGRLVIIESPDDFQQKVVLEKRDKGRMADANKTATFTAIIDKIEKIIEGI